MDRRKLPAAYLIWRAAKKGRAHPPERTAGGGMGVRSMAVWLALGALLGLVLIHIFR